MRDKNTETGRWMDRERERHAETETDRDRQRHRETEIETGRDRRRQMGDCRTKIYKHTEQRTD